MQWIEFSCNCLVQTVTALSSLGCVHLGVIWIMKDQWWITDILLLWANSRCLMLWCLKTVISLLPSSSMTASVSSRNSFLPSLSNNSSAESSFDKFKISRINSDEWKCTGYMRVKLSKSISWHNCYLFMTQVIVLKWRESGNSTTTTNNNNDLL